VEVNTQVLVLIKQADREEDLAKAEALDQVHNLLNQEIQELLVLEIIQAVELQVLLSMVTLEVVELEL
jgi:hypothetical protein